MRPSEAPKVPLAAEAGPLGEDRQGEDFRIADQGGPTGFGGREACSSFHQSSTSTYNETKKESRPMAAPSFERVRCSIKSGLFSLA